MGIFFAVRGLLRRPRIEHRHACSRDVSNIARYQRQVAVEGRRGQQSVDHWQQASCTRRPRGDVPPTVGDRLVDGKDAAGKAHDNLAVQPRFQRNPAGAGRQGRYVFADFAQGQYAQMQQIFGGAVEWQPDPLFSSI